jgi:hypothetical protein
METMGLTEEHVRLTTGAATAAVIRHGQVLVPKEGNEERKPQRQQRKRNTPTTHSNTERERQKNSQPSRFLLTEVIPHPHSSSVPSYRNTSSFLRVHSSFALFIHSFFQNIQKSVQSPQSSTLIRTLHPYFLPEEHPLASEFILRPSIHPSFPEEEDQSPQSSSYIRTLHPSFILNENQSPQSSSYIRTLHPSFILNENQSPPRGIMLAEFIPHPYYSSVPSRRTSVGYSQYTVTKVHPSSALFIHPAEENQWP